MKKRAEPKVFDYSRPTWGYNVEVTKTLKGGKKIEGFLWGPTPSEGDYLILKNGDHTTRYQVTEATWLSNVDDMYAIKADFAPREPVPVPSPERGE